MAKLQEIIQRTGSVKGLVCIVSGIFSIIVLVVIPYLGPPIGVFSIMFGSTVLVKHRKEGREVRNMVIVGMILALLGIILAVIILQTNLGFFTLILDFQQGLVSN